MTDTKHYADHLQNSFGGPATTKEREATDKKLQDKLDKFVNETAAYLRPVVAIIEELPAVTQNHYGRYLSILLQFEDVTVRKLVVLSLLAAGANVDGVRSAAGLAW